MPSIIPPDKNIPASQSKQKDNASWESNTRDWPMKYTFAHYSKKTLKILSGMDEKISDLYTTASRRRCFQRMM